MFRNREIRQFAELFAAITAAAAIAGFMVCALAGILVMFLAAVYGAAFFLFTKSRYGRLAEMSEQIDLVLHNADRLFIGGEEEGELSILSSEINKMTIRIREQNDALRKEKEYLADSLADIAHQLRTPLTSVNLILSLLEKEKEERGRRELLRQMEELLVRMDYLITVLLKLSRLDAGIVSFHIIQTQVRELVDTALQPLLIPMELHSITVKTQAPLGLCVRGDPDWLSQAIQNVIKNCMESAGDGGEIRIECDDNPFFAEITIRDNGPGFDREDIPHLFDRFYRGKGKSSAGYGIGLALCRTILASQGGMVTAGNHPEGGAVFSLRFPKDASGK